MRIAKLSSTLFATLAFASITLASFAVASTTFSTTGMAQTDDGSRSTEFVAVQGASAESVPGGSLMLAAYAFAWAAVFYFVWRTLRMRTAMHARLERAEAELQRLRGEGR